jgi:hypothetical protein
MALMLLFSLAFALPTRSLLVDILQQPLNGLLLVQIGSALALTLSVYLARRWFDRRSFTSLGLQPGRRAWMDLLAGFLIAALLMLFIFFVERGAGWLDVQGLAWSREENSLMLRSLLAILLVFVFTGWQEELYWRGYFLQNVAEGWNLAGGVLLSALAFGLVHAANPGFNLAALTGTCLAGLLFAYAWLATRQLWLALGLHIGWNFFQTALGFPVSGLSTPRLIAQSVQGPQWITGGAYGPEAGAILLPALAIGALCIYLYTRRS